MKINKFIKKYIKCTLMIFAGALVLSGCSNNKMDISTEIIENTNVSFSWWGNDERHQYTLNGIQVFEEQNEGIKVSEEYGVWNGYELRNKIKMNSKTNTDVMQINYSWLSEYSEDGEGYYDLYKLSDIIDLSQFSEEDLEIGSKNGHLNALPIAYNMSVMFFNKTIFDSYGLEVPSTWDDLFEAAEVMSKDGIYPLGTAKKHLFLDVLAYYEQVSNKSLFNEDGKFIGGQEDLEIMLEFYKRLVDEKVLMPIDDYDTNSFQSEEIAGVVCWISDASINAQELQAEGKIIVQSELLGINSPDTTGWYIKPATLYAISADTNNPEEAAKLVNFLLNSEDMALLQGTEKGVPVSRTAFNTLETNNMLNTLESSATNYLNEKKDELSVILPIMESSDLINGFKNVGDKYIYDQASLEECSAELFEIFKDTAQ